MGVPSIRHRIERRTRAFRSNVAGINYIAEKTLTCADYPAQEDEAGKTMKLGVLASGIRGGQMSCG